MLSRQTVDNALSRAGRALRKGSDILKTLAYLLDPEGHPEPAEEPSRGNHDPFEDVPGYPVAGTYPVIIPPEAEEMIRKANLPKASQKPIPCLSGSIEARSGRYVLEVDSHGSQKIVESSIEARGWTNNPKLRSH